jgi:3-hydroxyisobutyrate dehydrogenase-like beta-hydroxyacid dehydrogenase
MVGGEASDYERARPLLESVATTVRHLGPLGSGELTKILNNLLYFAQRALANDAAEMARAAGLEVEAAVEIWLASSGASRALDQYRMAGYRNLIPRQAGPDRRSVEVIAKDLALAAEVARTSGVRAEAALAIGTRLLEQLESEAPGP